MIETAKDFEARIFDIEKTTSRLAAIEARDAQIRADERGESADRAIKWLNREVADTGMEHTPEFIRLRQRQRGFLRAAIMGEE